MGIVLKLLKKDGFDVLKKVSIEHGKRNKESVTLTTANSISATTEILMSTECDLILLIGDRYETLGIAIACAYLNKPIAHIQGGEISGSIDENIRHCITKLSNYHFVSTKRCANIVNQLGEDEKNIFTMGCPSSDAIINKS